MRVTEEDLQAVSKLIVDWCGIYLDESKGYLVETRLAKLLEEYSCNSYLELTNKVRYSNDLAMRNKIIDAMTTNETLFFRDSSPFKALQTKILPDLIDSHLSSPHGKRLRIWSAACSTGQEPYSIAMTIYETIPDPYSWDISILGTDISDAAISRASAGYFPQHEINRGMTPGMLDKYFTMENDRWKVQDKVRGMVSFQRRNLLESFYDLGPFDIIFCRNVAIYFMEETRCTLFNRLADTLTRDGFLVTGSSESLTNLGPRFVPQCHAQASIYQPNKQAELALAGA